MSESDPGLDSGVDDPSAARRRALKSDAIAALAALLVGVYEGRAGLLSAEPLGVAAVLCVATAGAMYAVERDLVPGLYPEVAALAALVGLAALGGGLALALPGPLLLLVSGALAGFGVGLLAYRTVFGLLLPVPQGRLERT